MSVDALVKSISIDNMVNQREAVVDLVRRARLLLLEAEDLAEAAHMGSLRDILSPHRYAHAITFLSEEGFEQTVQALDGDAWQYLMTESGNRTFMDATARREWDTHIKDKQYPPLTKENVIATFGALFESRGDMFERGVLAVFRRLSWDYKTNQPFKFGKRIIMERFGYSYIHGSTLNELEDLHRVFCVLDGKPEPDSRDGIGFEIRRLHTHGLAQEWTGPYFSLRWFKKGTAHVCFLRPDLVTQMNKILAKHYPNALAYREEATT